MHEPLQSDVGQKVIIQLRSALSTAEETNDPTIKYMIARALRACMLRWDKQDQLQGPSVKVAKSGLSVRG
jgi:hypothetical protein